MTTLSHRLLRMAESIAWLTGGALLIFYAVAVAHANLLAKADVVRFSTDFALRDEIDTSAWSESRRNAHESSYAEELGLPEALLRIPAIGLEAPVWEGVDSITLNRAVGRVPESPDARHGGNTVLAAHRDGYFRKLGQLAVSDLIELLTADGPLTYRVSETTIVEPDAVEVMAPTADDVLTLITCYPFYYVGPAPKRFVVRAVLEKTSNGDSN